ncbi:hypothetical protein SAMN05444372_1017 [Flavobacterium micromati]|jgi:uncharacterized membrane protein (DUF485 family)|uniref:Uncharacterized protein n=1 Tax=Flavobacterium micromati TaxID=229205 RepID=A0A1M5F845_9FLAO|nr:hypothetical protein SAMN05444372_1017 [Flavobacterium micromati]
MPNNILDNIMKKSPKERFLLVMAILFLLLYFALGLFVIFMKNFPLNMDYKYRIAFGCLLIIYSFVRCYRIIIDNKD